jgi:outer membrane immunogenic protein
MGYRWQTGSWVWGIEGQGNWADFSSSNTSSNTSLLFAPFFNRSRLNAFGLITGQVGYAWNNALFYVKGGAAVTGSTYDAFDGTRTLLASADETSWGGTVGAGFEYGFAPDWSIGVEYDHLFMGGRNVNLTDLTGAFFESEHTSQDVDIGLVRLNYRFGGPLIAKY